RVGREAELGGFPERFAGRARRLEGGPPSRRRPPTANLASEDPLERGIAKLKTALRSQEQRRIPVEFERHAERVERTARERELLDSLLAQGVPPEEAIPRARAAFKGEMATFRGPGFGLTDEESEAFWKVLIDHPLSYERQRGFDALIALRAQEPLQPNEIGLLRRLYGDDFAEVVETVGAGKRQFAKEISADYPRRIPRDGGKPPTPEELGFVAQKEVKPGAVRPRRGLAARAWGEFMDVWKFPQAFMQSFDISGAGRQGLKLATRHPREWWRGTRNYIKAIRSEADAVAFDTAMREDGEIIKVVTSEGIQEMKYGEVATELMDIHRPLPGTEAAA
ncbi:hypothetical protein LCGC14_3154010, partial [marine sediment metagenome]